MLEDLARDQMVQIESDRAFLPGVAVVSVERRSYPNGPLASHVVGYLGQISAEELVERRAAGYTASDLIGRSGLERQWENYLRGKDGFERVVVDARGQRKTESLIDLDEGPQRIEQRPGHNVVTTIDVDLQKATERALSRRISGAAVVVEVHTGRVLAMASWPEPDPNRLAARITRDELERMQNDKQRRPLLDKTVRENYFPGSTFKIVPALAALLDGWLDPSERQLCRGAFSFGGRWFHCVEAHKRVNLIDAIAASCNVYFYQLGDRLGIDRMAEVAREFGFGATTGLGINGEVPGYVPTMVDLKKRGYQKGMALITAIGQESVKATVLQVAMAYAAVATSGDLYVPMLIDRIESPTGDVVQEFSPKLRHKIAAPDRAWQLIQKGLFDAVWDKKGTSWDARVVGVDVAGKTGTAQVANRRLRAEEGDDRADHAWFASYGPSNKPEIAVAVMIEHGGFGAKAATPIAMDIYKAYFKLQREGRFSRATKPPVSPANASEPTP